MDPLAAKTVAGATGATLTVLTSAFCHALNSGNFTNKTAQ
jgi:hypothetical protein